MTTIAMGTRTDETIDDSTTNPAKLRRLEWSQERKRLSTWMMVRPCIKLAVKNKRIKTEKFKKQEPNRFNLKQRNKRTEKINISSSLNIFCIFIVRICFTLLKENAV